MCPGAHCGLVVTSKPESNADFYWGLSSLSPLSNSNDMHVKYIMANFLTISASVIKVAFSWSKNICLIISCNCSAKLPGVEFSQLGIA